jgi:hypothetical protein
VCFMYFSHYSVRIFYKSSYNIQYLYILNYSVNSLHSELFLFFFFSSVWGRCTVSNLYFFSISLLRITRLSKSYFLVLEGFWEDVTPSCTFENFATHFSCDLQCKSNFFESSKHIKHKIQYTS